MEPTFLADLLLDVPHREVDVPQAVTVTGICTDTRALKPGELFFALKGDNSDGHRYVRQALGRGAAAAVVSEAPEEAPGGPLIVVDDTVRALGLTARNYRRQFRVRLVAITGSVGKTSVREMTAAVLRARYLTLASEKNYNNEIGVPLTLFDLSPEHEAAVIEMGMRGPGEIDWLAEIAEPTIGLVTNIGHSHLERLGTRDGIAQAKSELLARLPADGIAILPRYDDYFDYLKARTPAGCRVVTFSDSAEHGPDVTVELSEGRATLTVDRVKVDASIEAPASHAARNAAAAIAVGLAMSVPPQVAASALQDLKPIAGRLQTLSGKNGLTVLNDCYNAAPESMAAALARLAEIQRVPTAGPSMPSLKIRRVAVLGDMRELGDRAPDLHRAVGRQVVDAGVRLLITVGELAREIARAAESCAAGTGRPAPLHVHFADSRAAAARIDSLVAPADCVLVKGSRAMEMETIVAALTDGAGAAGHE